MNTSRSEQHPGGGHVPDRAGQLAPGRCCLGVSLRTLVGAADPKDRGQRDQEVTPHPALIGTRAQAPPVPVAAARAVADPLAVRLAVGRQPGQDDAAADSRLAGRLHAGIPGGSARARPQVNCQEPIASR
jgi:hypothetical protein